MQLRLLLAYLREADLLGHLGREDDGLLRLMLCGVLFIQGCQEVRLAIVRPCGADEGR